MIIKITGLEKKQSATHVILILRGEVGEGKGCLLLIKDQAIVKTFMNDVRHSRIFDFEGEMTTLRGQPILNVVSYAIVSQTVGKTDPIEEMKPDPVDTPVKEPEKTTEKETLVEEPESEPETTTATEDEIDESDPNVTVEIIKYVPVVGLDIKMDSLYFKGYQTLESYLDSIGKKIDKTLKFY